MTYPIYIEEDWGVSEHGTGEYDESKTGNLPEYGEGIWDKIRDFLGL
jgi:hypothetical protein